MNEKRNTPDPAPDHQDPPRRRLLRSRDDRMLAGVAGGLAAHLNVDPTLVRVGFVAATLFSGLGVVAYLVLAVVTPNDDGTGRPAASERPSAWLVIAAAIAALAVLAGPLWGGWHFGPGWLLGGGLWLALVIAAAVWVFMTIRYRRRGPDREPSEGTAETEALDAPAPPARRGDGWSRVIRAVLIGVLIVVGLHVAAAVAGVSAWATATGHGAVVGGVVIAIGAVLVGAALLGDRRWRWLIVPALVLALPAGAVAAADIRFDGDVGQREYAPASAAAIPPGGYRLGVGEMTVDLRRLPWKQGRTVSVRTDMGLGQTVIAVPDRVCVDPDVRASAGEVTVRGTRSSGLDAELIDSPPRGRAPRLRLDSEIEAGQIEVTDGPPEAITAGRRFGHPGSDTSDDSAARARALQACRR